ncbi:uncharacterized protein LOC34618836 [Cyclospora cayetanensis]|uniref:Uncharacterized protein LOC34618836 n=1 Tax=Cyclospora cayetanensis TaxID=88456 RepID=A0A6P6S1C4_9EIME|nr:uncharacterized protein LOC34618836 [Cyclospora cayetanensis]
MEIPTFQSLSDDCLRVADALYNARHDMLAEAVDIEVRIFPCPVCLLCLLLITAEAGRVLHLSSMDQCMETRFGFFSNVTSRAIIYFYLGIDLNRHKPWLEEAISYPRAAHWREQIASVLCLQRGFLVLRLCAAGLLFMGAGVISIVFRRRQVPPEGEVLPNY